MRPIDRHGQGLDRDRVKDWLTRLPIALAVVLLLAAGAVRLATSGVTDGTALLAAGLVCLGVWIVLEVQDRSGKD